MLPGQRKGVPVAPGWKYLLKKQADELPWKQANNSVGSLTLQTSQPHSFLPVCLCHRPPPHIPWLFSKTLLEEVYVSSDLADTLYIYCDERTLSLNPPTADSWKRNSKVEIPTGDLWSSQRRERCLTNSCKKREGWQLSLDWVCPDCSKLGSRCLCWRKFQKRFKPILPLCGKMHWQ